MLLKDDRIVKKAKVSSNNVLLLKMWHQFSIGKYNHLYYSKKDKLSIDGDTSNDI